MRPNTSRSSHSDIDYIIWVLSLTQLGTVVLLRVRVERMAAATALVIFVVYIDVVAVIVFTGLPNAAKANFAISKLQPPRV